MGKAPGRRDRGALLVALAWTLAVALLLLWLSGFAGGIGPLFEGSLIPWFLAVSPIVPIIRWIDSRVR
jgi:fatty acid desaturase